MFHGAPGGRGMDQLVGWSRGDHGGPVWERFLQEGYVVAVADYRGGDWNQMNKPSSTGLVTAIDDGITVVDYVQNLPYVKRNEVSVYGVSLGGNLAMFLASRMPTLHAVVAGAPAPVWFLGYKLNPDGSRPDFSTVKPDPSISKENIAPIRMPVLIIVGTEDRLCPWARRCMTNWPVTARTCAWKSTNTDITISCSATRGRNVMTCRAARYCCPARSRHSNSR